MPSPAYHNEWDQIVTGFIARNEPFLGYWERSEKFALELIDSSVRPRRHRLLDLGCGGGRLLVRYAKSFDEVVALEPDPVRMGRAVATAREAGLNNVRFVNALFEDCASNLGAFDVVLCSHVIQHLPLAAVEPMMQRIYARLVRGGLVVLLTAHSCRQSDAFKLWSLSDTRWETEVGGDEFNRILADECRNDTLPIHAFGLRSLRELLAPFQLLRLHCFHALERRNLLDAIVFRDRWINWPLLQGDFGIDVLVAGRRIR